MDDLKANCTRFLDEKLTIKSVVETLIIADKIGAEPLKTNCIKFICAHMEAVEKTSGWKKLKSGGLLFAELMLEISAAFFKNSKNVHWRQSHPSHRHFITS